MIKTGWRLVRHPLRMCVQHGWTWSRQRLISPRGTQYEIKLGNGIGVGLWARRKLKHKERT